MNTLQTNQPKVASDSNPLEQASFPTISAPTLTSEVNQVLGYESLNLFSYLRGKDFVITLGTDIVAKPEANLRVWFLPAKGSQSEVQAFSDAILVDQTSFEDGVYSVALSADSQFVAVGSRGALYLNKINWNEFGPSLARVGFFPTDTVDGDEVVRAAFLSDGKHVRMEVASGEQHLLSISIVRDGMLEKVG